jgi:hypothetical protein
MKGQSMKTNLGIADRTLRICGAVVLVAFLLTGAITGGWAIVTGIVAAMLALTGAVGFCPLYVPLKISTKKQIKTA